jgi:hypothetical protein
VVVEEEKSKEVSEGLVVPGIRYMRKIALMVDPDTAIIL